MKSQSADTAYLAIATGKFLLFQNHHLPQERYVIRAQLVEIDTTRNALTDIVPAIDVVNGERLDNKQIFADMAPGLADGLRCDTDGKLCAGAGWVGEGYDGVHISAPDGTLIGKIHLPEICANICFGGVKRNRLFMTGSQSPYSVYVNAQGVPLF